MAKETSKVAVGLSGGVDSSVAAVLLKEKGYDVVGIFMRTYDGSVALKESEKHGCYGPGEEEDLESAAWVCQELKIPFHVIDLRREYRRNVIDYFRREYLAGKTPNPCIICNQRLKFTFLLEKSREAGVDFDFFATGHYARIKRFRGRSVLKKGLDPSKDQSYFLYTLSPAQLSKTLFPIGGYTKGEVREIAHSHGLKTASRPESQDFIAGVHYSALFNEEEVKEGDVVDEKGNVVGRHQGIIHYTVGQRRGLGISSCRPLYVVEIDAANNRLVVSEKERLFSKGLIATDLHLMTLDRLDRPHQVKAKIRLNHTETDASVLPHEPEGAKVLFDKPQMSVTPGQSVVLYKRDTVFGGGIIEKAL